jgi:energy-coupling factor transporter ATP-binding protein EcfA2
MNSLNLFLCDLALGFRPPATIERIEARFSQGAPHLIIGPSGCGKTTLLLTLAGFLRPLGGSVLTGQGEPTDTRSELPACRLGGLRETGVAPNASEPTARWVPDGRVGLAFQNPESLFFCHTVGEEVTFALRNRGVSREEADQRGKAWLTRWGLDPGTFWSRHPFHLSGGEKRRVALAACSVFEPDLLLLDEPTSGLDEEGRRRVHEAVRALSVESLVLVVTHDPEELLDEVASILLLKKGSPTWFPTVSRFLDAALHDHDLYPLPDWYVSAMAGELQRSNSDGPNAATAIWPMPRADEVRAFLAGKKASPIPCSGIDPSHSETPSPLGWPDLPVTVPGDRRCP